MLPPRSKRASRRARLTRSPMSADLPTGRRFEPHCRHRRGGKGRPRQLAEQCGRDLVAQRPNLLRDHLGLEGGAVDQLERPRPDHQRDVVGAELAASLDEPQQSDIREWASHVGEHLHDAAPRPGDTSWRCSDETSGTCHRGHRAAEHSAPCRAIGPISHLAWSRPVLGRRCDVPSRLHRRAPRRTFATAADRPTGVRKVTVTLRPPPGASDSSRWPPLAVVRASTMASPSPVPSSDVVARQKRRVARIFWRSSRPGPSSTMSSWCSSVPVVTRQVDGGAGGRGVECIVEEVVEDLLNGARYRLDDDRHVESDGSQLDIAELSDGGPRIDTIGGEAGEVDGVACRGRSSARASWSRSWTRAPRRSVSPIAASSSV